MTDCITDLPKSEKVLVLGGNTDAAKGPISIFNHELIPLAQRLQQSGINDLATVRFIADDAGVDSIPEDVLSELGDRKILNTGTFYLVANEYPVTAGGSSEALLTDYAIFRIPPESDYQIPLA
jgi:hypothetical protein